MVSFRHLFARLAQPKTGVYACTSVWVDACATKMHYTCIGILSVAACLAAVRLWMWWKRRANLPPMCPIRLFVLLEWSTSSILLDRILLARGGLLTDRLESKLYRTAKW